MSPSMQDSREATPSISAPRRLNSQAERRVKQTPALHVSQKKHGLLEDCNPHIADPICTALPIEVSRAQSKIQSIINSASYLRRHSSDEPRPHGTSKQKFAHHRAESTTSVVEFPKATLSYSLIPVRSPKATANNQRKRLLSRNEEEVQPRVRQRLRSTTSIETLRGITFPELQPPHEKPQKGRRRLDSMCNSIFRLPNILDPGRSKAADGVVSTDSVGDQGSSDSLKRRSFMATLRSMEPKNDSRVRKPFAHTQTPSIADVSNSHSLNIGSVVDNTLANEAVTLAYDGSARCLDDLEEIPDLPLSQSPPLVPNISQNLVITRSNLDRFEVNILSTKNTEVWDTAENCVYAWEGSLRVTDNNVTAIWANTPPVDCIILECRAREPPTSPNGSFSSSTAAPLDYQATYQGQSLREDEVLKSMDYTRGITVNKKWDREYSYQEPNKVVWLLKFWVPIPMSLFHKVEDRQFRLRARLAFRDPSAGGMKVVAHSGSVDMSISSLKTAKFVRSPQ